MGGNKRPRKLDGFTLIELLIAVALMAVVAILAWRGLDTVLQARQRVADITDDLRGLTLAMGQLDDDVRRSWSVRQLGLPEPALSAATTPESPDVIIRIVREASVMTESTRVQRVVWRVRAGVLERGFESAVTPQSLSAAAFAAASLTSADSKMIWQTVWSGVRSWTVQAWLNNGQGWVPAEALAELLPGTGVAPPEPRVGVTGLRVQLVRQDGATVTRWLLVKD